MKKQRFISMILALALMLSLRLPTAYAAASEPELSSAKCAVIGETVSGTVLFEKNADEKAEPASITKMMTLLLAVEAVERGDIDLDDKVTAQDDCRFDLTDDSSNSQIFPGERMSFKDLLYCAALASANEACNVIAARVAGSIKDFVGMMNEKAASLGCEHTHFANTHGLPDEEHYTTARDLFTIACEGMRHELFRTLVSTAEYTTAATNASGERQLRNSNALLTDKAVYGDKYAYDGAIGIKTGHTNAAGYCLASCAERDGLMLTAIVLGCEGDPVTGEFFDSFIDSKTLLDWAFDGFELVSAVKAGESLGTVPVAYKTLKGNMSIFAEDGARLLVPSGTKLKREINIFREGEISPSRRVIGELILRDADGTEYGRVGIVSGGTEYEMPAPEPSPEPTPTPGPEGVIGLWNGMDGAHKLTLCIAAAMLFAVIVLVVTALCRRRKSK